MAIKSKNMVNIFLEGDKWLKIEPNFTFFFFFSSIFFPYFGGTMATPVPPLPTSLVLLEGYIEATRVVNDLLQ